MVNVENFEIMFMEIFEALAKFEINFILNLFQNLLQHQIPKRVRKVYFNFSSFRNFEVLVILNWIENLLKTIIKYLDSCFRRNDEEKLEWRGEDALFKI